MEFGFGLGCGVFVNNGKGLENANWVNWRSFFFQIEGFFKMKISE
jgi:hypothetical protein